VNHFYHYAYLAGGSRKRQSFMRLLWLATVWVIWLKRNDIIFNNKAKSMHHLLDKVKYLSMWRLKKNVVNISIGLLWWQSPLDCLDVG